MALAENLRIATWNVELFRRGPGLLLRDIALGKDAQVGAVQRVLARLDADVILLTNVDYDRGLLAARALVNGLADTPYPHVFALRPNTGMATGLDLDGDGRLGGAGDAQGWGRFSGQGGMLILSRLPIDPVGIRDFSTLLWADLPGALLPVTLTDEGRRLLRLSTTGHWEVPLVLPDGGRLGLLAWHATPPAFDGPEERNRRRNHDETAFWLRLFDGQLAHAPPTPPFVLVGDANLDPLAGDGRRAAMVALLSHPALRDPAPLAPHLNGKSAHDTAIFARTGGLRVDYVLPSTDLVIQAAGILRPDGADPALDADLAAASRHFPVWLDLVLPAQSAATP